MNRQCEQTKFATASDAPVSVRRVALIVNDAEKVGTFYQRALGLEQMSSHGNSLFLGAGNRALLELRENAGARRAARSEAGLFHTAFLLPRRADLASWVRHASRSQVLIAGASDHGVSEALYLSDPEHNGIEVYCDRPPEVWARNGESIDMVTERLDLDSLMAEDAGEWAGVPGGTVIGHVHMQVGAIADADAFFGKTLGLINTSRLPGGTFYASGGYHHHLAGNVWNSRNAGRRDPSATGLAEIVLGVTREERDRIVESTGSTRFSDPWGIEFTLEV